MPDILFYLFAGLSLIGAVQVLCRRNPMNAAVSMVVTVLSIAVLYILLSAYFIAAAQMIVYAGAIVVLFIFVIMLLNLSAKEIGRRRYTLFKAFAAFVAAAVGVSLLPGVRGAPRAISEQPIDPSFGSAKTVGRLLFGEFLLPFELTSILILAAMVAGVVLAKRDITPNRTFSPVDAILDLLLKSDRKDKSP